MILLGTSGMKVPTWFWIVAGLALAWEIMGVMAYLSQVTMTEAEVATYPPAQRALFAATPPWVFGAFAVSVFGGLIGAVGLLLRRAWAQPLFVVSLVGAVLQFGWVFFIARAHETIGPSAVPFPLTIIAVGIALVWFSRWAVRRRWLS
jgi:ABC-type xylose transport system permease subunit